MKSKFRKVSAAILFLAFILITIACQPSNPFVHTPISGETVVDTHEQEIVFDKPFKPKKMVNKVCFKYSNKLKVDSISEPPRFLDDTLLQLTASVIDQNGKKYELNHIENSVEDALCIIPSFDDWLNISKTDIIFVKLIVHSNRKINVSQILWVSYDIWDI